MGHDSEGSTRGNNTAESCYSRVIEPRLPLIYVFLSGLGFSLQNLVVKLLEELYGFKGSFQCVFARGITQLLFSSYLIYYDEDRRAGKGPKLFGDTWYVSTILFLRAFLGYFGIAFGFLAMEYIPMGDASVLVMLSPIVAALAGWVILGEPWKFPEFTATMLAVIGSILVVKPPFLFGYDKATGNEISSSDFLTGIIYALIAAFGAGFAFVFVRLLGTTAKMPWTNICFSQAIAQIILSPPNMYLFHQTVRFDVRWEIYGLITLGACIGCVSQVAMTVGMQREKSATASAMRMSDVGFGFLWQLLFTTDAVSMLSVIGALLVVSGIGIIILFKKADTIASKSCGKSEGQQDVEQEVEGVEMVEGAVVRHDEDHDLHHRNNHNVSENLRPLRRIVQMGLGKFRSSLLGKGSKKEEGPKPDSLRNAVTYSRLAIQDPEEG
eukprot:scaffold2224_cov175-Ochromonas_danica.AAC.4